MNNINNLMYVSTKSLQIFKISSTFYLGFVMESFERPFLISTV
jgi:hypothetical protein